MKNKLLVSFNTIILSRFKCIKCIIFLLFLPFLPFLLFLSPQSFASVSSSLSSALAEMNLEKIPFTSENPELNYTVDLTGWPRCAAKLKECRPARFNLPNPAQIAVLKMAINFAGGKRADGRFYTQQDIDALVQNTYQDYIIRGWKQDKCQVTIVAKPPPKDYVSGYPLDEEFVKQMFPVTKVNCAFTKKEISVLLKSAEQMEKEEDRDFSLDEKAGQILSETCHPLQD